MASSGFKGFGSCEQVLLPVERFAIVPVTNVLDLLLGDVDLVCLVFRRCEDAACGVAVACPSPLSSFPHGRVSSFLLPTMLDVFAPDASSIASSPQSAGSSSPIGESSLLTQSHDAY